MNKYNKGLFIGRFQPVHNGHLKYIKKMLSECDKLVILIGSSHKKGTNRNPYNIKKRKNLLLNSIKEFGLDISKIEIGRIRDFPDDNDSWFDRVIKKAGDIDIYYSGENEITYKIFKEKKIKTHRIKKRYDNISATNIRKLKKDNADFSDMVTNYVKENI